MATSYPQATATGPKAFKLRPSRLNPPKSIRPQNPNTATVTIQHLLRGEAPPNPEATLEVGTNSSDPPNNELKYDNPTTRTVSLKNGVTVVKLKAETAAKTFQGKIKVSATLGGATKGIEIKDSEPKDYIAELTILDP